MSTHDDDHQLLQLVLRDMMRNGWIRPKQLVNWVRDGVDHAMVILREPDDPPAAAITVFWLRCYGSIVDVLSWAEDMKAQLERGAADDDARHNLIGGVLAAVEVLRESFSVDELLWLEYRRHTEAHPSPTAFEHAIVNNGDIRREFRSKTLLKRVSLAEFDAALTRVFDIYDRNERRIAVAFAQKSMLALQRLGFALQSWAATT
jgi:hypothetical protein